MALGQHIRLRLNDDSVIAPAVREQRIVARIVLERGEAFGLLAFSAADTHLHMETTCDHGAAKELARRVEGSVTKKLHPVGFAPARVDPIELQWHLHNLCDYILRQPRRHTVEHLDQLLLPPPAPPDCISASAATCRTSSASGCSGPTPARTCAAGCPASTRATSAA